METVRERGICMAATCHVTLHPSSRHSFTRAPHAFTPHSVWLTLNGPAGMLGGSPIYLANSKNCFERNQIDTFIHEIPVQFDCGSPLNGIALQLEGNMTAGLDWHLDWISVTDVARGHTYMWR